LSPDGDERENGLSNTSTDRSILFPDGTGPTRALARPQPSNQLAPRLYAQPSHRMAVSHLLLPIAKTIR
jgi:hypothetical protein